MKVDVVFDICSYWHAGTGRGAGPDLDALVFRTQSGLPCLPGRTVKGLLRDAMTAGEHAGVVPAGMVRSLFGTPIPHLRDADAREAALEKGRFGTKPGKLRFESARLGKDDADTELWESWARENREKVATLFRSFASTRVGRDGLAADESLRAIEVVVPLRLRARVEGSVAGWVKPLGESAELFLRGLGTQRNRGFGRVRVSVEEVG